MSDTPTTPVEAESRELTWMVTGSNAEEPMWAAQLGDYELLVNKDWGSGLWNYRVDNQGRMNFESADAAKEAAEEDMRSRLTKRLEAARITMSIFTPPTPPGGGEADKALERLETKHCGFPTCRETQTCKHPNQPVAWAYELATSMFNGNYSGWMKGLDFSLPTVPTGAVRNLQPLYASPPPAAGPTHQPWIRRSQPGADNGDVTVRFDTEAELEAILALFNGAGRS
jgi:hypothetical protein